VRRALDAGASAEELLTALGRVADRELPQPLTYLLRDVGRRHGHVEVLPLGSAVVSADPALLAEICASRSLADLKLRALAPTVLASGAPVQQTVRSLRSAGYVPVARDAKGNIAVERAATRRAPAPGRAGTPSTGSAPRRAGRSVGKPAQADAHTLARRLADTALDTDCPVDAGSHEPAQPAPTVLPGLWGDFAAAGGSADTVDKVRRLADHLSDDDVRVLAHAVEHGDPVQICCTDARGRHVDETVSDLVLVGTQLVGWCHRSNRQRSFVLDDIGAVAVA
jgi:hypothetical protein